jgi:hypothetical protein
LANVEGNPGCAEKAKAHSGVVFHGRSFTAARARSGLARRSDDTNGA